MQGRGWKGILIFVHIIIGIYFLNYPFQIMKVPEYISVADKWFIFLGGILVLLGAINYFRTSRRYY